MGKKKAVDLNVPPLTPVVIGQVKKPKFVVLKVFLLIGLFAALIFYLPEVAPKIDKYLVDLGLKTPSFNQEGGNTTDPVVNPPKEDDNKKDDKDEITKYVISETTSLDLTKEFGVLLSDISYEGDILSLTVTPSEAALDLSEKSLYVVIYSTDDIVTDYLRLMGTITKDAPSNFSIRTTGAIKFSIKIMNEEEYPLYDISIDDKGNSSFTCVKDGETLGYTFLNDELVKINYTISVLKTNPKYDELYTKYNELYIKQKTLKGVTASFKTSTDDLKYNVSIDYATAAGTLEFEKFYPKGTKANLIMFELKSEQYSCN